MFAAIVLACWATSASACSVPVFRYALEHWEADPYLAVIFHRGEMTAEQQALVEQLRPTADEGYPLANLIVRTVDLDTETAEVVLDLWKRHETDSLPLLSLQTPPKLGPPQTAWSGELTSESVSSLMNSPTRQQLHERLLGGESVVWVFLESGSESDDAAAFALLEAEVARLQGEIELPPIELQDLSDLSVAPSALRIAFSALRVSRDDPREQHFVEMLLRVEPDLRDEPYIHQPMAFPVFGRGRALYALVGDGITPETIEDASRFLTGACQCTVKAQNPGVDLVMAVDWERLVRPALPLDETPPPLSGLTAFADPAADDTGDELPAGAQHASESEPAQNAPGVSVPQAPDSRLTQTDPHRTETLFPVEHSAQEATVPPSLAMNVTWLLGLVIVGVLMATLVILSKAR